MEIFCIEMMKKRKLWKCGKKLWMLEMKFQRKDCRLAMELTITRGRGYVSADKGKTDDMPIGVIAVDAIYKL